MLKHLLIRKAIIVDETSSYHLQKKDILIQHGIVQTIADDIDNTDQWEEYTADNLHISPGFLDLQANLRNPGLEYKETFHTAAKAAQAGGFTSVCVQSSTSPAIDNKSQITFLKTESQQLPIHLLPIGAVTMAREGENMAEMYDMHLAGAVAFSDDKRTIENPKLFSLAVEYVHNFGGLIIHFPDQTKLSEGAMMHEGETSVSLGLKGVPAMVEELAIHRDLYMLEYLGGKLHYSLISTQKSTDLIAAAKNKNINVTCAIAPQYLLFKDTDLVSFDSNYKVKPPYREQNDIEALIQGLKNGTIDAICSDHSPEDEESKLCELDYASYGIVNLETCFAAARTALKNHLSVSELIQKLSIQPRKILNVAIPSIQEGQKAEFTAFNPDLEWTFEEKDIQSKSKNSPFVGFTFTGKVLSTFVAK